MLWLGIDSETKVDSKGEIAAFCNGADHWLPRSCKMIIAVASEQMQELFGWDIRSWDSAGVSRAGDGWCPAVVGPLMTKMLQESSSWGTPRSARARPEIDCQSDLECERVLWFCSVQ